MLDGGRFEAGYKDLFLELGACSGEMSKVCLDIILVYFNRVSHLGNLY